LTFMFTSFLFAFPKQTAAYDRHTRQGHGYGMFSQPASSCCWVVSLLFFEFSKGRKSDLQVLVPVLLRSYFHFVTAGIALLLQINVACCSLSWRPSHFSQKAERRRASEREARRAINTNEIESN
jgi:hypothetical protein